MDTPFSKPNWGCALAIICAKISPHIEAQVWVATAIPTLTREGFLSWHFLLNYVLYMEWFFVMAADSQKIWIKDCFVSSQANLSDGRKTKCLRWDSNQLFLDNCPDVVFTIPQDTIVAMLNIYCLIKFYPGISGFQDHCKAWIISSFFQYLGSLWTNC